MTLGRNIGEDGMFELRFWNGGIRDRAVLTDFEVLRWLLTMGWVTCPQSPYQSKFQKSGRQTDIASRSMPAVLADITHSR